MSETSTPNSVIEEPAASSSTAVAATTSAIQAALPTLQANITTSFDTRIHDAMQQRREQLQTWMQQQLGEVVASITTSGQTHVTNTVYSVTAISPAEPIDCTSTVASLLPTGGHVVSAKSHKCLLSPRQTPAVHTRVSVLGAVWVRLV